METEYIPLKEATKFCKYSQDYLKLRARQGKLKAVKIGRNWLTKREWIEEYLKIHPVKPRSVGISPKAELFNGVNKKTPPVRIIKTWWLGLMVLLLLVGGIVNYSKIIKEYFQWLDSQAKFQTANLSKNFNQPWKIIPGRVIEIK